MGDEQPPRRQQQQQQPRRQHQGVLWKRRDVFKNKWRPRWFVLQPEEAVLTYYLLSRTDAAATSTISTPLRRSNTPGSLGTVGAARAGSTTGHPTTIGSNLNNTNANNANGAARGSATTPRRRNSNNVNNNYNNNYNNNNNNANNNYNNVNHSVHSTISELTNADQDLVSTTTVSENPVDYDVVPRGAIYLAGCKVAANDALSVPSEGLFAFSIVPPSNNNRQGAGRSNSADDNNVCHLSARTEEARAAWVTQLSSAAVIPTTTTTTSSSLNEGSSAPVDALLLPTTVTNNTDENSSVRGEASSTSPWKSISPPSMLFENVPAALATRIEETLQTHLELCNDDDNSTDSTYPSSNSWTPVVRDGQDGVSVFQRQDQQGFTMMKSTAVIPHHPKQVMNLLLDPGRRTSYEPNVSTSERLDILNHHTFLDYYAFRAVWPTAPRSFAVAVHWQVLRRQLLSLVEEGQGGGGSENNEEALVTLAFSCPGADELKEPTSPHVRANLHASFYLLRLVPVPGASTSAAATKSAGPSHHCHLTRILSYDLGGSLPRNLANTVLLQQAGLPSTLSKYLRRLEPTPEPQLCTSSNNTDDGGDDKGCLTNEGVVRDVVKHILRQDETEVASNPRRRLAFDDNGQATTKEGEGHSPTIAAQSSGGTSKNELSLLSTGIVLLLPVLLYYLSTAPGLPMPPTIFDMRLFHPAQLFSVTAFFAVRYVMLCSLGGAVLQGGHFSSTISGPTTCQFSVDLKGVLQLIGMQQKEIKERAKAKKVKQSNVSVISVVHIVATALAKAMQNHSTCWNSRRVQLPWLFVKGCYRYSSSKLDVSIVLASGHLVSVEDFQLPDKNSIGIVARAFSAAEKASQAGDDPSWMVRLSQTMARLLNLTIGQPRHGRCMIVLTKTDSETDNQSNNGRNSQGSQGIQMTQCQLPKDLDVLVVVGGIRLQRSIGASPKGSSSPRASLPKPVLSLSLAVNTANALDMAKYTAFAEDLQNFIQFPELCDDQLDSK